MTNLSTVKEPAKDLTRSKPVKKDFKWLRDKDREMVRGIFRFFEVPGGTMAFPFRKWKEDKTETFSMNDGEIYTIPRGVAHHLSNNCWYPEHAYKVDEYGRQMAMVSKKKRRCSFEPLDFMDIDDMAELTPGNVETITVIK